MKGRTVFQCQDCGARATKWMGRCPDCGAWSSMKEGGGPALERVREPARPAQGAEAREPARRLADVDGADVARIVTGVGEFDRCLGGGLVPGSLVLLGGEPGIGKSTLLLQVSDSLVRSGRSVLYVSGEESPAQVRLRAERLGVANGDLWVLGETDLDAILSEVHRLKPSAVVVDSVQVVHDASLASGPGTVSQVKQAADRFLHLAKETGIAVFLIGHVTKEGTLAGPRTLEHVVDTVLSFETEAGQMHRLVRAVKNRFGPAGEIGVFEMKGDGLAEVPDASRLFLAERRMGIPGSVVFASIEGTRPVLVEIQALVGGTPYSQPRRQTLGIDSGRFAMLLAVLERRVEQKVMDKDVFVNVAGGLRLRETAADLAVAMAIVSATLGRPVPDDIVFFGEIGLAGEVRSVDRAPQRLREARAHGFMRCVAGRSNATAPDAPSTPSLLPVDDVESAIRFLFQGIRMVPR